MLDFEQYLTERLEEISKRFESEEVELELIDTNDEDGKEFIAAVFLASRANSFTELTEKLNSEDGIKEVAKNVISAIISDEENDSENEEEIKELINSVVDFLTNLKVASEIYAQMEDKENEVAQDLNAIFKNYEEIFEAVITGENIEKEEETSEEATTEENSTEEVKVENENEENNENKEEISQEENAVNEEKVEENVQEENKVEEDAQKEVEETANSEVSELLKELDESEEVKEEEQSKEENNAEEQSEELSKALENADVEADVEENASPSEESEELEETENAGVFGRYAGKIVVKDAEGKEIVFEFINPEEAVSDKPQGKVDKSELRKIIISLAERGIPVRDIKKIANRIFGLVRCVDSPDCLKFPFAEIRKQGKDRYIVLINRQGVKTSVVYLTFPNVKKTYKKSERLEIAGKLLKVYKLLGEPAPGTLAKFANNAEEEVALLFKDEKIVNEIANILEVPVEDVVDYYEALNGVINSLFKAGLIDVVSDEVNDEETEHYIVIENAEQFIKLLNKFNKFVPSVINSLTGEEDIEEEIEDNLIKEYDSVKMQLEQALEEKAKLEEQLEKAIDEIKDLQSVINDLKEQVNSLALIKDKYNILLEIANNNGLGAIVDTLTEISDRQELEFFKKYQVKNIITANSDTPSLRKKLKVKLNSQKDEEIIKSLSGDVNREEEEVQKNSIIDIIANYI